MDINLVMYPEIETLKKNKIKHTILRHLGLDAALKVLEKIEKRNLIA